MSDQTASQKHKLRQECKRIRASTTPETQRQVSQSICRSIDAWQEFKDSSTILTYLPMQTEVDLIPLLDRCQDKRWAVPRILPAGQMVFHVYDPSRLTRHPYGMLEPDQDCPLVTPGAVQLALVPGLSFDVDGWRLGYGGGFYDRFLSSHKGISAGITYQALYLDHIPHASHDIPMQFVVTETGIKQPRD